MNNKSHYLTNELSVFTKFCREFHFGLSFLDLFAFSGSPEHVGQQVQSLIDAGASRVELGTPQGINTERGVRLIGERVLPLLRR